MVQGGRAEQWLCPSLTQLLGKVELAVCHPFTESFSGAGTTGPRSNASAKHCPQTALDIA